MRNDALSATFALVVGAARACGACLSGDRTGNLLGARRRWWQLRWWGWWMIGWWWRKWRWRRPDLLLDLALLQISGHRNSGGHRVDCPDHVRREFRPRRPRLAHHSLRCRIAERECPREIAQRAAITRSRFRRSTIPRAPVRHSSKSRTPGAIRIFSLCGPLLAMAYSSGLHCKSICSRPKVTAI